MQLITMAHLGEALSLIELFQLKRISPQVYENEELTCLITGEGPFEAATLTAHMLGQKKFQKVINLGIAGSLEKLEMGQIYPVRSLYLVIEGKPQFKSFKVSDKGVDCLTSFERILSSEKAQILSGLGQLVDREAWGVAMAAKSQQIDFEAFKLISDEAGTLGACELIREEAQVLAEKLAQFLKNHLALSQTDMAKEFDLPGFHFTFTTQHQLEQYLRKLSLREEKTTDELLAELPLQELREEKILPKERARRLLSVMERRLDPLKEKLEGGLEEWKKPLVSQGLVVQTDATWESTEVKISLAVNSQVELEEKLKNLKSLDLSPFYDLREGKFHVE